MNGNLPEGLLESLKDVRDRLDNMIEKYEARSWNLPRIEISFKTKYEPIKHEVKPLYFLFTNENIVRDFGRYAKILFTCQSNNRTVHVAITKNGEEISFPVENSLGKLMYENELEKWLIDHYDVVEKVVHVGGQVEFVYGKYE